MTWVKDKEPEASGYYLTYYYNKEKESKWKYRFDPDVKCWWNVRHDYYIPCEMQANVDPIPRNVLIGKMEHD